MSFYGNLLAFEESPALFTRSLEIVRYRDLLALTEPILARLKPRRLAFHLCQNDLSSISGYLAFLRAGVVPLLIKGSIAKDRLDSLVDRFKPDWFYVPRRRTDLVLSGSEIYSNRDYVLLNNIKRVNYPMSEDLALLLSTSGSTGSPKLVRLSYENVNSNAHAIASYLNITDRDRAITTMPMAYTYGLSIIHSHLLRGASVVLSSDPVVSVEFWNALKASGATNFGGVPYIFEMLKKLRFDQMELPALRYLTQAGGKLSESLVREFSEICETQGKMFYVMYGQTEATARMSYLRCDRASSKNGSIGVAIPGGQFSLADDRGNEIRKAGISGELLYQGPNVCLGYAESYSDLAKGDENHGRLHTGDLAQRDDEGFYYIVGRKNRFLKIMGHRICLGEVEALLNEAGFECVCSGTDERLFVYLTKADDATAKRACRILTSSTGIHPTLISIIPVPGIPRDEAGKVLYSELGRLEKSTEYDRT